MDNDQQRHLEELRRAYQKRLRVLELQSAQQGLQTPAHIVMELEELRQKLADIDRQLGAGALAADGTIVAGETSAPQQAPAVPPAAGPVEISPGVVVRPWNLGFDLPVRSGRPPGWSNSYGYVDHVSIGYIGLIESRRDGEPGNCVKFYNPLAKEDEFGSLMQRCLASTIAGREVMLEGQLRTRELGQWAGLWLRADGVDGPLFFDNMSRRPIQGSTPWTTYTIITRLPAETTWLNYGILLVGRGIVWADNFRLMVRDARGAWLPLS